MPARLPQIGAPEAIYRAPNSPFVASFLGADNVLSAVAERAGADTAIRLAEGLLTHLPSRHAVEGPCHIHFRSHAVQLGASPDQPGLRLAGTITQASYPGGTYRYEVETSAGRFFVDDARRANPGDRVEHHHPGGGDAHLPRRPASPPELIPQKETCHVRIPCLVENTAAGAGFETHPSHRACLVVAGSLAFATGVSAQTLNVATAGDQTWSITSRIISDRCSRRPIRA